jgi:hypothetical protein
MFFVIIGTNLALAMSWLTRCRSYKSLSSFLNKLECLTSASINGFTKA